MENITKALLIAGGILIVIMVITLAMSGVNQISSYYAEQHERELVKQATEVNNKFDNYAGQNIRGNEILSIINRVVDYNNYQADIEGYEKITFYADLKGKTNEFVYDTSRDTAIIPSEINNKNITEISDLSRQLTTESHNFKNGAILTEQRLQKLAGEINNIIEDSTVKDKEVKEEFQRYRQERLKKIFGLKKSENDFNENEINTIKKLTSKYYQIMQFKRAMFLCKEISYNTENGKVNKMTFEIILENGQVKFE